MENKLVKAMALNGMVRIYCINTTNLTNQLQEVHDMWPTSLATIGRVSSIGCVMAAMLKNEGEKVVIQINGHGPIGTVMVSCKEDGTVKGFVGDPHIYLKYNDTNKLAVGQAVGVDGYLKVTKDLNMKSNFTGQVELQSGEIGDDFAYYFMVSEQTPSVVSCGVLVDTDNKAKSAGALLIQLMPDATEDDIVKVEELTKTLKPISTLILEKEDPEAIVKELFDDVEIVGTKDFRYHCDCSKERFHDGLKTLKLTDLKEILMDNKDIEIKCEFCNHAYNFTPKEIAEIIEERLNNR